MSIFLTQGRFTREYIRGGLAKPEKTGMRRYHGYASKPAANCCVCYFALFGHYDFLVISDMPDQQRALAARCCRWWAGAAVAGSASTWSRHRPSPAPRQKTCLSAPARCAGVLYKPMGAS